MEVAGLADPRPTALRRRRGELTGARRGEGPSETQVSGCFRSLMGGRRPTMHSTGLPNSAPAVGFPHRCAPRQPVNANV